MQDVMSSNPLTWSTEENLKRTATVYLGLLNEKKRYRKIQVDRSGLVRKLDLGFELPREAGVKSKGVGHL